MVLGIIIAGKNCNLYSIYLCAAFRRASLQASAVVQILEECARIV